MKKINENIVEFEGKKYEFVEVEKEENCCINCDFKKGVYCLLPYPQICCSKNRQDEREGYFKLIVNKINY